MRTPFPDIENEGPILEASTSLPKGDLILTTLDKGLTILETLAEHPGDGLTLTELGRALGMHRSTLFRFLATLRARGYVERDPATDRYRLGVGALTLTSAFLNNLDLRQIARPFLQDLCDRTQELVHLTRMDRDEVVTIDRIEGNQPVSLQTDIGARRPAYCTASGKVFLAYLPAAETDRILARGMDRKTATTITTPAEMHAHLAEARRRGYAVDDEERIDGVRCVASPIFDLDGNLTGTLSIAAPTVRTSRERLDQLGEAVREAAAGLSRQLGYAAERCGGGASSRARAFQESG
jgi:IclR family KDG regulon transcriptional repressor